MSVRFSPKRLYKPLGYAAAAGTTVGLALYTTRKSNVRPEPQSIPLKRDESGKLILPSFPRTKSRAEQIAELKRIGSSASSSDEIYDLLVIGGGATGTGIALDAATRGLKVALVEREDFSSGTSSKSTKLVHGGVRYLEKAVWNLDYNQYELVKESLRERKNFLYTAPHLSLSLPILLPLQRWLTAPYFWAGTKAYDMLAGSEGLESSYFLSRNKAIEAFPLLKKDNLVGALVYYDGSHNDSRMNVSLAMTAALYGATTVNHLEVTGLEKDANGKLCGARVRDMIPDRNAGEGDAKEFMVRAKGIVNATGPFADAILNMDEPAKREIVAPSSGVHIVLPGHLSPKNLGLLDAQTSDGRVLFFLPWQGNTIAGTTDAPCGIERNPVAGEEDIDFILEEVTKYITPDIRITRDDVLAAWSGIRPLIRDPNSKNTESLVRNHLVTVSKSGLLTCAGGKWTTYRQMAEDAVDEAIDAFKLKPTVPKTVDISGMNIASDLKGANGTCQTQRIRLVGAHGFSKTLYINLIQQFGLEADVAQHLAANYGDRAFEVAALCAPSNTTTHYPLRGERLSSIFPYIDGEVRYAVQREYAQTAVDVIARRTRLSFLNAQAALEALPKVIDLMSEELQWSQARKEFEWTESVHFLGSMGLAKERLSITREEVSRGEHRLPIRGQIINGTASAPKEDTQSPGLVGDFPEETALAPVGKTTFMASSSRPEQ